MCGRACVRCPAVGRPPARARSRHRGRQRARRSWADLYSQHKTRSSEERQAEKALKEQLAAREQAHQREIVRALHDRYASVTVQLAHSSAAVRLAAIYAVASLGDDWNSIGDARQRQVCIDLLRAYLRVPRSPSVKELAGEAGNSVEAFGENEVRQTIVRVIATRRRLPPEESTSWLRASTEMLRSSLEGVDLRGADLIGVVLRAADLTRAELSLTDLREADLRDANLSGAKLRGADLRGADARSVNVCGADLSGAKLTDVNFDGLSANDQTIWPWGYELPLSAVP
ncbi:pentapeptide repeat-containing protein [Nocardia lijiangensis]|uniref:pentapeptide repeat-containing protein n=1 Tax=Nocardia lijiangensis TaxID=299618 RepID=UPI000A04CB17